MSVTICNIDLHIRGNAVQIAQRAADKVSLFDRGEHVLTRRAIGLSEGNNPVVLLITVDIRADDDPDLVSAVATVALHRWIGNPQDSRLWGHGERLTEAYVGKGECHTLHLPRTEDGYLDGCREQVAVQVAVQRALRAASF